MKMKGRHEEREGKESVGMEGEGLMEECGAGKTSLHPPPDRSLL